MVITIAKEQGGIEGGMFFDIYGVHIEIFTREGHKGQFVADASCIEVDGLGFGQVVVADDGICMIGTADAVRLSGAIDRSIARTSSMLMSLFVFFIKLPPFYVNAKLFIYIKAVWLILRSSVQHIL